MLVLHAISTYNNQIKKPIKLLITTPYVTTTCHYGHCAFHTLALNIIPDEIVRHITANGTCER